MLIVNCIEDWSFSGYRLPVTGFRSLKPMKHGTIFLHNREVEYQVRKHKRAKRVNIRLYDRRNIRVTVPRWVPYKAGEKFLHSQKKWLTKNLKQLEKENNTFGTLTRKDYLANKEKARRFLYKKIEQFNQYYGFSYNKIFVKDQRSRWGSCSSKGNLNFSYKVIFLPWYLADYIIVHELCHLGEMGHSPEFWQLVVLTIPDYKKRRKELRKYTF